VALLHKPNCANWYQRTGEGRNERVALAFEGGFRLVAAGDPARLNVSRHGYQTFDDGMVKRPQHLRYRPFNAGRPIQQRDS